MGAAAGRGLHTSNRSLTLSSLSCRLIPGRGPTDPPSSHRPGKHQPGIQGLERQMFQSQMGTFSSSSLRLISVNSSDKCGFRHLPFLFIAFININNIKGEVKLLIFLLNGVPLANQSYSKTLTLVKLSLSKCNVCADVDV